MAKQNRCRLVRKSTPRRKSHRELPPVGSGLVSVARLHVYVNGRLVQRIPIDPDRNLSDRAERGGPQSGQIPLQLSRDSWIVLEAVGDRPMFPVITGTEEPFLLVSDAVARWRVRSGLRRRQTLVQWWLGIRSLCADQSDLGVDQSRRCLASPGWFPGKKSTFQPKIPVSVCCTRNHD